MLFRKLQAVVVVAVFWTVGIPDSFAQYGIKRPTQEEYTSALTIRNIEVKRLRESSESGQSSRVMPGRFDGFWYRLGVTYESQKDWADGLVVKYYVLLQEKTRAEEFTMLVGDIEYDSVPRGTDRRSFMYIHPRTVERYGKPERVMCEIWHDGVLASREVWPKGTDNEWWVRHKPMAGNLKPGFFTPFILDRDAREENINIKSIFE
ncbi:MAG: hypothetical protein AB1454_03685 [Candidatus Auribacterota bacterium]